MIKDIIKKEKQNIFQSFYEKGTTKSKKEFKYENNFLYYIKELGNTCKIHKEINLFCQYCIDSMKVTLIF